MIIQQEVALVTTKYNPEPYMVGRVPNNDDGYYTILSTKVVEVDFDMPSDIEIRDKKIASLKAQRTKIQADAQVKSEQINEAIQSLMALDVSA